MSAIQNPTIVGPYDCTPRPPRLWESSNEEYHGELRIIGHTGMEAFRRKRPRYHAQFVSRSIVVGSTAPMNLGSAFHALKLEPGKFLESVVVAPKVDRRTTKGKKTWSEFMAAHAGKIILPKNDADKLEGMLAALQANRDAMDLLSASGAIRETAILFNDPVTGLPLKVRPDHAFDEVTTDVKTSQSAGPEAFARVSARYGYHRQASLYRLGRELYTGKHQRFFHIVVETGEEPYECAVYEIHPDDLGEAHEQNAKTLEQILECAKTSDWRSPHTKQAQQIRLPRYSFSDEYEIE